MTFVSIDISRYYSREPDPDDSWDIGDQDGHVDRVYIATRDYERGYNGMETDLVPPFFVVYAEYSTGCTFGTDYEACIVGVVKSLEEADALEEEAKNFSGFGSLSNGFYVPWTGYFERLIATHITAL